MNSPPGAPQIERGHFGRVWEIGFTGGSHNTSRDVTLAHVEADLQAIATNFRGVD